MTILITGGTGFVGLALAAELLGAGGRVVLFGAEPPSPGHAGRREIAGATLVVGDVRDADALARALRDHSVERIAHLAAITPGPEREIAEARRIVDVNVGGTVAVMDQAAAARIERVLVASSVAVYGFAPPGPSGRYDEVRSPSAPAALYGITKLAAEQAALHLGRRLGLDTRVARLGPVFGPWEEKTTVRDLLSPHAQTLRLASRGEPIVLPRAMEADWLYSRDAARGLAALLGAGTLTQPVYNVGGERRSDLIAWCRLLEARRPGCVWGVADASRCANVHYGLSQDRASLCTDRIATDTGVRPRFDLTAAAADYLAFTEGDVA